MKEPLRKLKIYSFSSPVMKTELLSVLGSKFEAFPVPFEFTLAPEEADVLIWDGIFSPKSEYSEIIFDLAKNKMVLLLGESQTLFNGHPIVRSADLSELNVVELSGWNVLPEEILNAFQACYQKLTHV
jgi:Ni,Fe-hydrogenase III small subunit